MKDGLIFESILFYEPVSIRKAVENVNDRWFLPAIQRPYDWGNRTNKEQFIYKLFDSIIREYPIGTLIIWETDQPIPHRPFLTDFDSEKLSKIVDKGQWSRKDKLLIYDGQQRLQSLYSCLKHTFHNQVLCYNTLFDPTVDKLPKGFKFYPKHEDPEIGYVKLNEVYVWNPKQQSEYEDVIIERIKNVKPDLSKKEEYTIKNNIKQLWKIFIEDDIKLLSYYPLKRAMDQIEVLDIFNRINTTGMILTRSEILFSKLKNKKFDYEEQIWEANRSIKKQTGGFSYSPDSTLQVLNMIVKGTIRIDPDRVNDSDMDAFIKTWSKLESPLKSFFSDFLYGEFRINHEKIVPIKAALIPLIVYFYYMKVINGKSFKDLPIQSIASMRKYLITSQLLYWDLQSHIDKFSDSIKNRCQNNSNAIFPFDDLKIIVENEGRRNTELTTNNFENGGWFSLKIITPNKQFNFEEDPDERFNPEIDHIFPMSFTGYPSGFWPNIIWNLQPVKGDINGHKLNTLPSEFFKQHPQYLKDYDFLPTTDFNDKLWAPNSVLEFIQLRRDKIVTWVKQTYDIDL